MPSTNEIQTSTVVSKTRSHKSIWPTVVFIVVIAAIAAASFFFFKPAKKEKRTKELAPVTVSTATLKNVPLQLKTIGTVVPINSVSVKSRVGGRIISKHFQEGDFVKRKELLFTIDPRPLKAELAKAESDVLKQKAIILQAEAAIEKDRAAVLEVKANLAKDLAMSKLAEKDAARFTMLAKAGAVSDAEAERREATRESTAAIVNAAEASIKNAEAQIKADQANLKNAQAQLAYAEATLQNAHVQLNFTTVNAPIAGRTGRIMVLERNNIKPDEDVLVTINQIAPIYVLFSVPQEQFEKVQKYGKNSTLYAKASRPQGEALTKEGKVTFTDNTIDATTGTVKMKAIFDNADSKLWPNQYVNITLNLANLQNMVTVPTVAVQTGQNGTFVWLVQGDKVHLQPVKIGPAAGTDTSITEGLKAGDVVVTDGQIQLSEGAKIKVTESKQ